MFEKSVFSTTTMKLFIIHVYLISVVLAEPPIGEGYSARKPLDNDFSSPSQVHSLTSGSSSNTISEYDPPNARNSISNEYGPPESRSSSPSTEYGLPNARSSSLSSEYGLPNTRSSSLSSEYGLPNARPSSLSTEYGIPNAKYSNPSSEYGAPNARSSSLSNDYGPPKTGSSGPLSEYIAPNARSALSSENSLANSRPRQRYAQPAARVSFSQTYGASKTQGLAKSVSQEFKAASGRNEPSQQYGSPSTRSGLSQEYGTPHTRSRLSSEYGVPNTRSGISEEYGTPAERSLSQNYGAPEPSSRSLSTVYGVPDAKSTPSEEYGAPAVSRSGVKSDLKSSFRSSQTSGHTFAQFSPKSLSNTASSARSNELSQSAPKSPKRPFGSRSSSKFQTSKSDFNAPSKSFSNSYEVPAARNIDSYSQEYSAPSELYGAPAMDLSATYGAPSERGLSEEYGVPSSRDDLKTQAIVSSYSSARSSSSSYAPSSRGVSEQYGLPEQYDALNEGYNYARGNLDESDQEPANYEFAYKVNDFESGSDFGHTESRQENHAEGSYFVVLPDGTKQTVEYEADEAGFKPRISVEPSQDSGYDENASNLRSEGPY